MSSPVSPPTIDYPESDGKQITDNTKQFRYIVMIEGGIDALFRDDPNVFVAGDLHWYPVEGHPETRSAILPGSLRDFGDMSDQRRTL